MASRKEQKERLKAERLERERQAESAERRKRLVGYGAGGVLVAAVLAALVVVILAGGDGGGSAGGAEPVSSTDFPEGSLPPQETADLEEAADAASCKVQETKEEGNEHVPPGSEVEYDANPPTSGDHFAVPADDGAYTEAPETGAVVHALEHGRIFIQFDPAAPDSVKGDLKALYDEDPYHMVIAPNDTDMPYEVAATTWTRALVCQQMNEDVFDAIRAFRDEYRDEGPEFVP
jgi:hypothetical protein